MTVSVFDYENELLACAAGDKSSFLALYKHESATMYALCCAVLGTNDAANNALHETFMLIWRNAAGFSPSLGTARAWIYSILRYRLQAHARQLRLQGDNAGADLPLPQLNFDEDRSHCAISVVLQNLPDSELRALMQAYLHGGDYQQIARRAKSQPNEVEQAVRSVINKLNVAIRA